MDENAGWSLTLRGIQPILLALTMEEGSQEPRNVNQAALETGKGQAVDIPPEPPECTRPSGQWTLTLGF